MAFTFDPQAWRVAFSEPYGIPRGATRVTFVPKGETVPKVDVVIDEALCLVPTAGSFTPGCEPQLALGLLAIAHLKANPET